MLLGYNLKLKKKEEFEPSTMKMLKNGACIAMGVGKESGMKISKILSKQEMEKYKDMY